LTSKITSQGLLTAELVPQNSSGNHGHHRQGRQTAAEAPVAKKKDENS
jgi:hypothetical protein